MSNYFLFRGLQHCSFHNEMIFEKWYKKKFLVFLRQQF